VLKLKAREKRQFRLIIFPVVEAETRGRKMSAYDEKSMSESEQALFSFFFFVGQLMGVETRDINIS
jgi:hypothetical protein